MELVEKANPVYGEAILGFSPIGEGYRGRDLRREESILIIQVIVEDSMKEIYDSPGAKQQVNGAVLRTLFAIRDVLQDKISRQGVLSRGFIGLDKH